MRTKGTGLALLLIWAGFLFSATPESTAREGWRGLPTLAQSKISSQLGRKSPAFEAQPRGDGFRFSDPSRHWAADFAGSLVKVETAHFEWQMKLRSYGYGAGVVASASRPEADHNRIQYQHGGLTEWYVNGPAGLEQGFTLDRPPAAHKNELLTIALEIAGNLTPRCNEGCSELSLVDQNGVAHLRYSGLIAYDNDGKRLPASLLLQGHKMLLQIDDRGAQYPIVIDPWIQTAELASSDGAANDQFGWSVGISGNTVVVGAPSHSLSHTDQGAAYVFVMPDGGWGDMTQTAELAASDGAANDYFGSSVAISGNTIVVGADGATVNGNPHQGAAYVFVEPNGGWQNMTETAKLAASDGYVGDDFGASIAISGNTVAVGAPYASIGSNFEQGAAYVFVEPPNGWANMTETAKLTAADGAANDIFGASIALDGQVLVAGASNAAVGGNASAGAAYLYVEPQSGWVDATQTAKLTASDSMADDYFGASVSIYQNNVAVGAPSDFTGAAYVFVQPPNGWQDMTQTAELGVSGITSQLLLGTSIAITSNAVVSGAVGAAGGGNPYQGILFVFLESKEGWKNVYQSGQVVASDGAGGDYFGHSLALSGTDGIVAAPFHQVGSNAAQGSAYVFQTLNKHPQEGSLSPNKANAGGPAFQLTVTGNHFVPDSVVNWAGSPRQTNYVNHTELQANILASDIAQAGKYKVITTNPPPGGGPSNSLTFTVNNPVPQLTKLIPNSAKVGDPGFTMRVIGSNFAQGAQVKIQGVALNTTYVNSGEVDADVPANDLTKAGTFQVMAENPGGEKSNTLPFTVSK